MHDLSYREEALRISAGLTHRPEPTTPACLGDAASTVRSGEADHDMAALLEAGGRKRLGLMQWRS